jgi:hypothetical protein
LAVVEALETSLSSVLLIVHGGSDDTLEVVEALETSVSSVLLIVSSIEVSLEIA